MASASRRTSSATIVPMPLPRSRRGTTSARRFFTLVVDASHGYERIHLHALMSVAKLAVYYAASEVQIERDAEEVSGLRGFTRQKVRQAEQRFEGGRAGTYPERHPHGHGMIIRFSVSETLDPPWLPGLPGSAAIDSSCRLPDYFASATGNLSQVDSRKFTVESRLPPRVCATIAFAWPWPIPCSLFSIATSFHVLRWIVHPHERLPITDRTPYVFSIDGK